MINFKELFQEKNEDKLINFFQNKLNMMSDTELNKFLNYKDFEGNTLLHHAHLNKCTKLAKMLYNNRVGLNIANNEGNVIIFTESDSFSDNSNDNYNNTQSDSEINQSFFSDKQSIQQNTQQNIPA